MLNMRSTYGDDLTAKARIRDAAIACVAENGTAGTTVRKVASMADVSPGLVIHHFGSMDSLRKECDEYVASMIREAKLAFADEGVGFDLLAALRDAHSASLAGYLATVLADDSPAVSKLIDDLVADAEKYIERYVQEGWMTPSPTPRARAVILMVWSLGALVLHRHMHRLIGIDMTDPQYANDPERVAAYWAPAFEILGGVFTSQFSRQMQIMLGSLDQRGKEPQEGS
jgi:AcrR family transcriptional regulator